MDGRTDGRTDNLMDFNHVINILKYVGGHSARGKCPRILNVLATVRDVFASSIYPGRYGRPRPCFN